MLNSVNYLLSKNFPWLLVVIILGFSFRIIFLNAPLQSDDTTYFAYASDLSAELFKNAGSQSPFRLGIIVPLALVQNIFGYSLISYYLYSLGSSLFLLAMVYLAGFKLGGPQTALFSGLLFACSFFGLYQTTNLLPDVPNIAFLLASFLAFIYVVDEGKNKKRILLLLLSALLAFCSYLTRAPNLTFLLAIPAYELLTRKSLKTTFLFSIILAILWIGECGFYQVIADDFFLRVKMVPKGATLWVKYMPEISWQTYLYEPFTRLFFHTFSGTIILWGGLLGTALALLKKNRAMIALLAGALLLFAIYSFSVTSFEPLRRALPLQIRYYVAFTAVLTIAAGYTLSSLKPILEKIFSANIANVILGFVMIALMGYQVKELPTKLPNTALFKNSSYFVADKLLKEKNNTANVARKVYAYPIQDFKMYPNFSQLDLKAFSPSEMKGGNYYLYSRARVRKTLLYGYLGEDEKIVRNQELLLLPTNPKWHYLINTKDIVLAYVSSFELKQTKTMPMDGSYLFRHWVKPKDIVAKQVGGTSIFHFDQREKPFYLYTFPGTFSLPPNENVDVFDTLEPGEIYELKIHYRLQEKIQNLGITFSQYDDTKRIDSITVNAPSTSGTHVLTKLFVTSQEYEKFRLFFRITNNKVSNQLEIEKISFNHISV